MKDATVIAAAALLAASGYYLLRTRQGDDAAAAGEGATLDETITGAAYTVADAIENATGGTVRLTSWSTDKIPAQYAAAIRAAEDRYGIPRNMLARLLWQESRFRQDIIDGRTRSAVGALGIAQFMPATAAELGVDPLDPIQAIDGAGKYLARQFATFGDWPRALAAYNWGAGNVMRKGLSQAPAETRAYYSTILADLGMSAGALA